MFSLTKLRSRLTNYLGVAVLLYKKNTNTFILIISEGEIEVVSIYGELHISTPFINLHSYVLNKSILEYFVSSYYLDRIIFTDDNNIRFLLERIIIESLDSKKIVYNEVFCRTKKTSLHFFS